MRVHKYIPEKLYGFAVDSEGAQVFFHLGVFNPGAPPKTRHRRCAICPKDGCLWDTVPPPPILGEDVEVTVDRPPEGDKAPRAARVERKGPPAALVGTVETFDAHLGYGFVRGENNITYHLHKSELLDGRLPRLGQVVMFFAGTRQGKPRAVHIKVCP